MNCDLCEALSPFTKLEKRRSVHFLEPGRTADPFEVANTHKSPILRQQIRRNIISRIFTRQTKLGIHKTPDYRSGQTKSALTPFSEDPFAAKDLGKRICVTALYKTFQDETRPNISNKLDAEVE